jgi:alpha-tubulin suppressor-like RCC1 family protein
VVVSGLSNVKQLSLGVTHSCAVLTDGSLLCWGNECTYGVGAASDRLTPTPVTF